MGIVIARKAESDAQKHKGQPMHHRQGMFSRF
jgi:hypothetical protein